MKTTQTVMLYLIVMLNLFQHLIIIIKCRFRNKFGMTTNKFGIILHQFIGLPLITICLTTLSSCQKVINIDLNSAAPEIVIEGGISDQPGPYTVSLTKTVNFSDVNTFPPVQGAVVTISDNAGNSEILTEATPGIYKTNTIQGIAGRTYTLIVSANGKIYKSVSTLSFPVNIDTLMFKTSGGFGGHGENRKTLDVQFTDPSGIVNYYRFIELINGVVINSTSITSDNLRDGTVIDHSSGIRPDYPLVSGDIITIQLQSIDYGVYEYFRTFNRTGDGSFDSSTPANPTSNLSNGALGYFSAYAVRSKSIIIP